MNLVKPPYICQGLWETMASGEKIKWNDIYNQQMQSKMTDTEKAANIILYAEPEALQHVLKTYPYLGEKLISKLEDALKKKELEEPEEVYIQFGKNDSTISTWRSLESYKIYKEKYERVSPWPGSSSPLIKFISEKKVDQIVKEKLTSILTSILKKVNDE